MFRNPRGSKASKELKRAKEVRPSSERVFRKTNYQREEDTDV
jgi:hypothetical protein